MGPKMLPFSSAAFYHWSSVHQPQDLFAPQIWNNVAIPRCKHFLWLVHRHRLPQLPYYITATSSTPRLAPSVVLMNIKTTSCFGAIVPRGSGAFLDGHPCRISVPSGNSGLCRSYLTELCPTYARQSSLPSFGTSGRGATPQRLGLQRCPCTPKSHHGIGSKMCMLRHH
ncbi:hypothetical protein SETIT_2G036600v2 [Setaria italica]|uniref:Uncharacterized protein n=1 Tax=Setaria italica TaxID=4555 RepID=A0A368PUW5_SETIT|nr:hypothetical protein SETIT_2G036600v2 [Setaria italica]